MAQNQAQLAGKRAQIDALMKQRKQASNNTPTGKRIAISQYRPPAPETVPKINQQKVNDEINSLERSLDKLAALPSPAGNLAMGVQDRKSLTNCNLLLGGELKDKGPVVPRRVPVLLRTWRSHHINPAQRRAFGTRLLHRQQ